MGNRDPRVDAYIARSAEFAQPILRRLREIIHEACPNVEETIKWGVPHYMYQGILSFDGFSPSQQREYVEWITETKRPETRARRVETAVEWLSEGKQRNWKYQRPVASRGA